ncbi:glycosyltransferase family 4 protein [Dysosmobacter welbionis]|uniref:glycosyltransferase family 4 protein n=1 Tax=Dysosmobacter welbionis TaxID=2093857 RepID=UPI00300F02D8
MDIWLINHYAVPPKYYPLARQTCFARYLMAMGHTVTIFAASTVHNSNMNLITDGAPWRDEVVDGVHYVYIRCMDYQGNGLKRIYNICEFAWKLPGVCRKFPRPDAIVATSMPPTSCAMGIHLARKYGCRGVAEIAISGRSPLWPMGSPDPGIPRCWPFGGWRSGSDEKADDVVFTCEGGYDYIVEQGWEGRIPRAKIHYINNGVDWQSLMRTGRAIRCRTRTWRIPSVFKVVYTGSIRKVNHLGLLLDAAKEVTDPRVKFLIWGDGDQRAALEQRVREEEISNVVFKGKVEKKYIPSIVSRADINLIHGGDQGKELFRFGISPNKMFDCFAAGRPILMDLPAKYNPVEQFQAGICLSSVSEIPAAIRQIQVLSPQAYESLCGNARKAAARFDFRVLTQELMEILEKRG